MAYDSNHDGQVHVQAGEFEGVCARQIDVALHCLITEQQFRLIIATELNLVEFSKNLL